MLKNFLVKINSYRFMFEELEKRDFKQKYKRTMLGMGWSIMSPLLHLFVMWVVFSNFFGNSTPHYITYLFAGNLIFNYFREATMGGMNALLGNANIFTKINVPKFIFLLSKNVSALINLGLMLVVFFLFTILDDITPTWMWLAILYPIFCTFLLCIGVGLILSALYVFFRDTSYLYDVFTILLMYVSAVFYRVDNFSPTMQKLFLCNPVYCAIKYVRCIIIDCSLPSLAFHALLLLYALIFLGIGILLYKKKNHKFLYYV